MNTFGYTIDQLARDLKVITSQAHDERQILTRARPLARQAALAKGSWIKPYMYQADPEQGFSLHLLQEQPDHSLAIFAVSWLPGRGTPPHDHGTWALVAGVDGPELNKFYRRVDDGARAGYARLEQIGEKVFTEGEVVAMPSGRIHKVWNDTNRVTLSLHIYGKHINFTGRSQFDLEHNAETPFLVKTS